MKPILDISEWQVPTNFDYTAIAQQISHVIVRVQYGSAYCDRHYATHLQRFKALGIPVAVYAWVRGTDHVDMEAEACIFYERAKSFDPTFYWLDVEEQSMTDMRGGVEAFRFKLKSLTEQKVGVYIANHLYHKFNLLTENFDALWLPTYGTDSGYYETDPTATDQFDLHQYTSNGWLTGYQGPLDLNRLSGRKKLDFFTQSQEIPAPWGHAENGQFTLQTAIHLRQAPASDAPIIALLPAGEVLEYLAFNHQNGHVWLQQKRSDGTFGYLASGTSDGTTRTGPAWGTFS
ncbi:GH25 family lysozyme [Enterococcus sp. CSURQ0835]|uniref:GH25 family lysozyme n=1 Tax=Enterococcus sp. CSURQ0835 TaxID=2681394 RepID=UPI001F41D952|nr:GH25 family lysozyme [Enterococcus sp. CSURQ0835]